MKKFMMSEQAFDELINGFEYVGNLTEYGKENIKYHVQRLQQKNQKLEQALDEIEKYIEEYQEERTYTDRGGFTCVNGHFLRDSDYLLEIIQKAKGDVKNENEVD